MRRAIVSMYVTLDGVIEDPGGSEGTARGGYSGTTRRRNSSSMSSSPATPCSWDV
jgi:hypothetical protein